MNRRQLTHLAILIAAGTLARALLFNYVGIWGDYGFYQYDARLILAGQHPFIDFLGRSPLFIYLYAATAYVFGHTIELARIFISFWWLLTALPVYGITKTATSHNHGLAAVAVFLLSPFALAYGMWANTQSVAAFFAATAIYTLTQRKHPAGYALAGLLLGLAYLSRRSVIVILFAVILYTTYSHLRYGTRPLDRQLRTITTRLLPLAAGFILALAAVYGLMASFNPTKAYALFEVHTMNLFLSYGRGGYPLITTSAPIVTNDIGSGRIPIFNDLCQMCGSWTARTFAKTLTISVPVVAILWYYIRDLTDHYFLQRDLQYMYGILAALAAYALIVTVYAGHYSRGGVIISLTLLMALTYRTQAVDRSILYNKHLQLVLIILLGLTAGYLYRNRILHSYYFMDFWPYISILAGILFVHAIRHADRRHVRIMLAAGVIIGTISAGFAAHPITVVLLEDNRDGWFTMSNLHDYQDDINSRTEPGDVVFTASPSYVANTHARAPLDRPRLHMVAVRYKDHGPALPQYAHLIEGMRNGTIKYVVFTRTTRQMLRWNESAQDAYRANYCRVESADDLYQQSNAYLYKYSGDADCPADRRPDMNISLTADNAVSPP